MADPWWLRAHGHLGSHSRQIHRRRFDGDGNAIGVRVPAAPALLKLNPPLPKCPSAIAMHTHPYLAVGVEMEGVLDDWIHLLQRFSCTYLCPWSRIPAGAWIFLPPDAGQVAAMRCAAVSSNFSMASQPPHPRPQTMPHLVMEGSSSPTKPAIYRKVVISLKMSATLCAIHQIPPCT